LFLLLVIGIVACKDNEPVNPQQQESFKASWLSGDWHLVKGVFLSPLNGDTVCTYSNDIETMYYGGGLMVPRSFKVNISFSDNGDFIYSEINDQDPVSIHDSWEWLNSSQDKTHIYIPAFRSNNEPVGNFYKRPYKIIALTQTKLVIEDIMEFYHLEFERNSICKDVGNFEVEHNIEPQAIQGSWKLAEYRFENNDGTSSWFKNDTLWREYYDWNNQLCVSTLPSIVMISVASKGDFKSFNTFGSSYNERSDYWYWTDANEPHSELYFSPLLWAGIINYTVDKLKGDSLVLTNTAYKITYRFSRMN
jgi:hypothetical protein